MRSYSFKKLPLLTVFLAGPALALLPDTLENLSSEFLTQERCSWSEAALTDALRLWNRQYLKEPLEVQRENIPRLQALEKNLFRRIRLRTDPTLRTCQTLLWMQSLETLWASDSYVGFQEISTWKTTVQQETAADTPLPASRLTSRERIEELLILAFKSELPAPLRAHLQKTLLSFNDSTTAVVAFSAFIENPSSETLQETLEKGWPSPELYLLAKDLPIPTTPEGAPRLDAPSPLERLQALYRGVHALKEDGVGQAKDQLQELLNKDFLSALERMGIIHPESQQHYARKMNGVHYDAQGPYALFRGARLREGDILLQRNASTAYSFEAMTASPDRLSHLGVIIFDAETERFLVGEIGFLSVSTRPLWILESPTFGVILRDKNLKPQQRHQISLQMLRWRHEKIPYDFQFDSKNHEAFYCSEIAVALWEQLHQVPFRSVALRPEIKPFFRNIHVQQQEFFPQYSFLQDPRFESVTIFYNRGASQLAFGEEIVSRLVRNMQSASDINFKRSAEYSQQISQQIWYFGALNLFTTGWKALRGWNHEALLQIGAEAATTMATAGDLENQLRESHFDFYQDPGRYIEEGHRILVPVMNEHYRGVFR